MLPVLFVTVFFALNFFSVVGLNFYDSQRLLQLSLLTVWLFLAVSTQTKKYVPMPLTSHGLISKLMVVVVLILLALSMLVSSFPKMAALELSNSVLLLFFLIFLSRNWLDLEILGRVRAETSIVLILASGLLLYIFQLFVGFIAGVVEGTSIEREVIVHHISNIRFFNHIQVLTLPILIVFSYSGPLVIRRLCAATAVLSTSVLLFLSARAAIGCLMISAMIISVIRFDARLIKSLILIGGFGGVFYSCIFVGLPALFTESSITPLNVSLDSAGRWDMWVEAIGLLSEHWLFGVGGMQYGYWSDCGFGHPHNLPLQIALEYGLPVFCVLAFVVMKFVIYLSLLYRKQALNPLEVACYWAFIAILGVSLFSGVWVAPLTQLMVVAIVAPLLAAYWRESGIELGGVAISTDYDGIRCKVLSRIYIAMVIVLISPMLVLVWPGLEMRLAGKSVDRTMVEKHLHAPRFWLEDYYLKQDVLE